MKVFLYYDCDILSGNVTNSGLPRRKILLSLDFLFLFILSTWFYFLFRYNAVLQKILEHAANVRFFFIKLFE